MISTLERAGGIAPPLQSWEDRVLLLHHARMDRPTGAAPASQVWKTRALLLSYGRTCRNEGMNLYFWEAHPSRMDLPSFQPDFQMRRASTRRGFVVLGPGQGRWSPGSVHRPPALTGRWVQQKNPRVLSGAGVSIFSGFTSFHRPRALPVRWFDSRRASSTSGNTNPQTRYPPGGASLLPVGLGFGRRIMISRKFLFSLLAAD